MSQATATRPAKPIAVPAHNLVFQFVPVGNYAVKNLATDRWFFFNVSRPKSGKWQGWTFLKLVMGERTSPVRDQMFTDVMSAIAKDPKHYAAMYGKRTGTCGICSKKLTDPASVKKGIGPVCEKRFG